MKSMHKIIGRKKELQQLENLFESKKSELFAIYGRRRVGKTYIIRSFFQNTSATYLEVTGLKDGNTKQQLEIFSQSLSSLFFHGAPIKTPSNWKQAFDLLNQEVSKIPNKRKFILFLDELPWLATAKSGLLQELDHQWNTRWSLNPQMKIILCGSAASWMIDNVVNSKGGLHNRLTGRMLIEPFDLIETERYLNFLNIDLQRDQILLLYMCIGGIPYYLNGLRRGESVPQAINRLCFTKQGLLHDEFERLYASLFNSSQDYIRIIKAIASKRKGILRNELLDALKIKSGGRIGKRLQELEQAGFISSFVPYGRKAKDVYFQVIDEYSFFYLKWIQNAPRNIFLHSRSNYWKTISQSQSFKSWCGYSFETICLKHHYKIQEKLDLINIGTSIGSWTYRPKKGSEKGAQIDLLFDRNDGIINLCEIKYHSQPLSLKKEDVDLLQEREKIFKDKAHIKKQIHHVLICPLRAQRNQYYHKIVSAEVNLNDLFHD